MTILRLQFVGLHEHLFVIVSMLTFGLMKLIATFDSGVTSEGRKTVSPKIFSDSWPRNWVRWTLLNDTQVAYRNKLSSLVAGLFMQYFLHCIAF